VQGCQCTRAVEISKALRPLKQLDIVEVERAWWNEDVRVGGNGGGCEYSLEKRTPLWARSLVPAVRSLVKGSTSWTTIYARTKPSSGHCTIVEADIGQPRNGRSWSIAQPRGRSLGQELGPLHGKTHGESGNQQEVNGLLRLCMKEEFRDSLMLRWTSSVLNLVR